MNFDAYGEDATRMQAWQEQLADDLRVGTFQEDFDINGRHYRFGAWNTTGDWWLAWNTEEEFQRQLATTAFEWECVASEGVSNRSWHTA